MRDRLADFGKDVDVAVILFTSRANAAIYARSHGLPFPVLVDDGRAAYESYGLGCGSVGRIWGPKSLAKYFEIFRSIGWRGMKRLKVVGGAAEDTLQLGGNFVIDPTGLLVYAHRSEGPDDRPDIAELIAALSGTAR